MDTIPEVKELEPTLLPPPSQSGVSTTLDRPISEGDQRIVSAAVAHDVEKKPPERFEEALRQILSVPKKNVDKAVAREKKAREAHRTEQPK